MSLAPLMSSACPTWQTPDVVLDLVRRLGPIALDPCAPLGNPVRARTFCVSPKDWTGPSRIAPSIEALLPAVFVDGLAQDWLELAAGGLIYVNSPYGREIEPWQLRCFVAGQLGGEVISLVPARTDTAWWNRYCAPPFSDAVCFWRGRLTFAGAPAGAPFPSAVVYWGPRPRRFASVFSSVGAIWS